MLKNLTVVDDAKITNLRRSTEWPTAVKDLHRGALVEWARWGKNPFAFCRENKSFWIFSEKKWFRNFQKRSYFEIFSNFAKHVPLFGSLCHEDQVSLLVTLVWTTQVVREFYQEIKLNCEKILLISGWFVDRGLGWADDSWLCILYCNQPKSAKVRIMSSKLHKIWFKMT